MELAFLAAVTFVAGVVRGITGFAGPLIMVPVLGFFHNPASAIATSTLVDLSSNVSLLPGALREAAPKSVAGLIAGALVTIPLGAYALLALDATTIAAALYAVVGAFSLVLLSGWRYPRVLSPAQFAVVGAGSGVILGATSFGIAAMPFLLAGPETTLRGRANFILWAFFCALVGFSVVLAGRRVGLDDVTRAALLIPFYLAGTFAGNRYAHRIDDARLRRIVLVVLVAVSVAGLAVRLR
jgi:uncharacterized membrane protein YfcA